MDRYVAFLRGMNLGNRRIKNDELRAEFEALGFEDVATFRASGNVIFAAAETERERADEDDRSTASATRSATRSPSSCAAAPRSPRSPPRSHSRRKLVEASKGKLQVTLLSKKPTAAARKKVLALATDEDGLAIDGRELFWLPSGGTIDSDLDLKAIDEALGKGTMRTMGTIEQIAAKHCAG